MVLSVFSLLSSILTAKDCKQQNASVVCFFWLAFAQNQTEKHRARRRAQVMDDLLAKGSGASMNSSDNNFYEKPCQSAHTLFRLHAVIESQDTSSQPISILCDHRCSMTAILQCRNHEIPALLARTREVETRALLTQKQGPDSLPSLLHCLASLYKLYPDLWLDETIR